MPAIIDSAPDCVTTVDGAQPADDSADFIIQAAYENCAGFMTFGPGSTYGEEGAGAAGAYMVLTWIGILVTWSPCSCTGWSTENRRLIGWTAAQRRRHGERAQVRARGEMDDDKRHLEFPPLQTHSRKFELAMLAVSIACVIIVLVILLLTNIGNRVPPDGLDRLAAHPVPSEAVEERPIRVRVEPPEDELPAARTDHAPRPARVRRAARGDGRRGAELPAVAGPRARRSTRSRPRGPRPASRRERTQVRLVRQGLNGRPFWAVSFSVAGAGRRRLLAR